jgi:crossover junction endodeoxyribonuclease RuvC
MPKTPAQKTILGIDPGSLVTGWGLVEAVGNRVSYVAHGTIEASAAQGQGERLSRIYRGVDAVMKKSRPGEVSLERLFFARNAQSALKLGQARGVALLAAAQNGFAVSEYTAKEIKVAVVGYGQATKEQVQKMVAALLGIEGRLAADAADALACAICHAHRRAFHSRVAPIAGSGNRVARWRDYKQIAAEK